MPELLEVEAYRRLAERVVGRTVLAVPVIDPLFLKDGIDARAVQRAVCDHRVTAARRIGKLLLLDLDDGPTVGLHFGMTGRLIVDGDVGEIDRLMYSTAKPDPQYHRFVMTLDRGDLCIHNPRRFGRVALDPDESRYGPDAATLTKQQLREALANRRGSLKTVLMDQTIIAGLGNLLTDEALWRAEVHPLSPAGELPPDVIGRLHRSIRETLRTLGRRGGSHMGDLMAERRPGGVDPKDGAPLQRLTIGGRTTWFSPTRQLRMGQ